MRDSAAGFRGHYRLAVTSTRGMHPLLEPVQPTEPQRLISTSMGDVTFDLVPDFALH